MATTSFRLIDAIRKTAKKLETGAPYQWGHMGSCNCGNLAQTLTNFTKAEIHAHALKTRTGDWSEQTEAFCATSNLPLDLMIQALLDEGLEIADLKNLEKLSDPQIRKKAGFNFMEHNNKAHVILYFYAWADVLEEELLATLPKLESLFSNEDKKVLAV